MQATSRQRLIHLSSNKWETFTVTTGGKQAKISQFSLLGDCSPHCGKSFLLIFTCIVNAAQWIGEGDTRVALATISAHAGLILRSVFLTEGECRTLSAKINSVDIEMRYHKYIAVLLQQYSLPWGKHMAYAIHPSDTSSIMYFVKSIHTFLAICVQQSWAAWVSTLSGLFTEIHMLTSASNHSRDEFLIRYCGSIRTSSSFVGSWCVLACN
jgi:hypothetical protein